MKKLLLGITVLALVLFASSAMAAGPKVPKALCLDFTSWSDFQQLAFKSLGNVPTSSGNVKMYAIVGHSYNGSQFPVHGSGYVTLGSTILHATYSGQYGSTSRSLGSYELLFDLATNNGTIQYRYDLSDGTSVTNNSDTVVATDCSALSIPSAMVIDGADLPAGRYTASEMR
jgi:hypothetical protein